MTCYRSKNDFFKKSGPRLIRAKGQTHHGSNKIGRSLRADMCIPDGLLFMWGFVPNFSFAVLVVASQKNPISALKKWKTHFFVG
jgi:hypothetical protein